MTENALPAVAAVDWGTSRFRLFLIDRDGAVLAQQRSDDGLDASREKGFGATLEAHLSAAGAAADLPVVICGMAGSRQGWIEAPYVTLPASPAAILAGAATVTESTRPIRIVPGLAQRGGHPDVIRGEETQLLGIAASEPGLTATVVMPGTHCKWVRLENGTVSHFSTCPTGELYALLARQSILRHSIGDAAGSVHAEDPDFLAALDATLADPASLMGRLFPIRAASLLDGLAPAAAAARLSGLLIGAEIAAALGGDVQAGRMILVASGGMASLYAAALDRIGIGHETVDADLAVRRGLLAAARTLWPDRFDLEGAADE